MQTKLIVVFLNYCCFAKFNLILQISGIHAVYSYINHHISSPVMWILTLSLVFSAKRKAFKNITIISFYFIFQGQVLQNTTWELLEENCSPTTLELMKDA